MKTLSMLRSIEQALKAQKNWMRIHQPGALQDQIMNLGLISVVEREVVRSRSWDGQGAAIRDHPNQPVKRVRKQDEH